MQCVGGNAWICWPYGGKGDPDCGPLRAIHEILLHVKQSSYWLAGIERAVREHQPKMLFMTSPNNPDGSMIAEADLLAVLALPVLVVLDEAYIEFSEEPSRMRWVMERPNLVVLRTFSKSAGLAGLRVGYGAFPAGMIDYLWRAKQPYNVSVAAETAACAALTNPCYLQVSNVAWFAIINHSN